MKNLMIILIAIQLLFTACQKKDNFFDGTLPEEGMPLLEKAIADEVSVGIAAGYSKNGTIQWEEGNGYSDEDKQSTYTPTTLTRIASIAKPMTAIAIMQLVEQQKIDLDAPIQNYLPNFPIKAEGVITTRHLLNHASGIDAYQTDNERENKKEYPNISDAVDIFKDRPLVATPGEAFNYTTYGYVVLGQIIESVSGMTYEDYMQQNIWIPARMNNTGVEHINENYPNKSQLFHRNDRGKIKKATATNLSDRVPGGGVYSCVTDMLKFGDAILDNSLIKQETMDLMVQDSGLKKEGNGYGYGWYLYGENPKYGNVFGHTGAQTGASAIFFVLPEQQTSIVVLANTSGAIEEVFGIGVLFFDIAAKG